MRYSTFTSLLDVTVSGFWNRFVQATCALRSTLSLTFMRDHARNRRRIAGPPGRALPALREPKSIVPAD